MFTCCVFPSCPPVSNPPCQVAVQPAAPWALPASPTQCLVDMQGRFFGGRAVHAVFFDEERLDAGELAPRPEEVRR